MGGAVYINQFVAMGPEYGIFFFKPQCTKGSTFGQEWASLQVTLPGSELGFQGQQGT